MRRICYAVIIAFIAASCVWFSYATTGGTASDPVITLGYINDTWLKGFLSSVNSHIDNSFLKSNSNTELVNVYNQALTGFSEKNRIENIANAVLSQLQKNGRYLYNEKYLTSIPAGKEDVYNGKAGALIIIKSGSAEVYSGSLIDITKGIELGGSGRLSAYTVYMYPEAGAGVRVLSDNADILIEGSYGKSSTRYLPENYDMAYALYRMGLIRGAAKGMELARVNTRAESVTMLIRLLAEEDSALSRTFTHPFKDVDAWAERYIGFAFEKGYANGVALDRFDPKGVTSANHYMTFILRALGYDDLKGDFKWDNAMNSAVDFGVITAAERDNIMRGQFLRDQMIYLSYRSLFAKLDGSDKTLLDKLIDAGAVNKSVAEEAIRQIST